ncbi:hypothetical protein E2N92_10200 [Methanofollis formosanus]|uniref:AAA family ATPase n=1 Tax=Methanofollis formosanus TaxID=299308 RepID=A0A8G1A1P6_9EURY|nr:AAA family ATPase [Methanofollis formosanus]QYZ79774.1 hypothetical protein E2N92_10200 [Methanofollis formosanus]
MPEKRESLPPAKILLVGTLGSGKTTVAEHLSDRTGIPYRSIDRYREEHGDGTVAGEYRAQTAFMEACSATRPAVIEFSGCGPHAGMAAVALRESGLPVSVIWLDAPEKICLERAERRSGQVPYPLPWGDVALSISSISCDLKKTWEWVWTSGRRFRTLHLPLNGGETAEEITDKVVAFVWE